MNIGHAPSSTELQTQVRSQRALIGALPAETVWAISVECGQRRTPGRRGVLSHDGHTLSFESWDGSQTFAAPLSKDVIKRRGRNRVTVATEQLRLTLRDPQDLKLVMSGSPIVPRRVADPASLFVGLFEYLS